LWQHEHCGADEDPRPPPIIHQGPQNQTLPVNSLALLPCLATGNPAPTIRWYKNYRELHMRDPRFALLDSGTLQIAGYRQLHDLYVSPVTKTISHYCFPFPLTILVFWICIRLGLFCEFNEFWNLWSMYLWARCPSCWSANSIRALEIECARPVPYWCISNLDTVPKSKKSLSASVF